MGHRNISHGLNKHKTRAVARALIGGGGCIFIYSDPARLVSFEIKLISKEVSRAEPEYMNIHLPPISVLATALYKMQYFPPKIEQKPCLVVKLATAARWSRITRNCCYNLNETIESPFRYI